jgi:hypothetical protein
MNRSRWKWYGHAGHFICSPWCQFHICTNVGKYLVSTVGEYMPDETVREITAQSKGVTLEGRGDARYADYMKKIGFTPMGAGPHCYETLVFKITQGKCEAKDCGCNMPKVSWSEVDGSRALTAGEATKLHMKFCDKWSGK